MKDEQQIQARLELLQHKARYDDERGNENARQESGAQIDTLAWVLAAAPGPMKNEQQIRARLDELIWHKARYEKRMENAPLIHPFLIRTTAEIEMLAWVLGMESPVPSATDPRTIAYYARKHTHEP